MLDHRAYVQGGKDLYDREGNDLAVLPDFLVLSRQHWIQMPVDFTLSVSTPLRICSLIYPYRDNPLRPTSHLGIRWPRLIS